MADRISVSREAVEEKAERIEGAADYFKNIVLTPQDKRTTIPANPDGQTAYERAQVQIERLGEALDKEVENIRSLHVSFKEFDDMMGELARENQGKDREKSFAEK